MFVSIMEIYTLKEYISSRESLDAKIIAIESLIDAMLVSSIEAVDNSGTASYSMNDGQMQVSTQFRSSIDVTNGIRKLEQLKNLYIGRRDGNITVLRGRLNH